MKKLMLATAIAGLMTSAFVHAEETPDNTLTFNAAVASDYRYRGISQTRLDPALQGGADYTNTPTGLYLGTWLSSIKWIKDNGGDSSVEWDIYGGKRGNFTEDFTYDVGFLSYVYVNNKLDKVSGWTDANTTEVYGQLGYGPAYVKYSYSVTDLFGVPDSKGSGYLDVGANIEVVKGLTVNLHAGRQTVENTSALDYDDWKVGITKDFDVVVVSLAAIGTNADKDLYFTPEGKFTGKSALVAMVSKTF